MASAGTRGAATAATASPFSRALLRGAEDGKLPLHFSTGARGTGDSLEGREDELLEAVFTMATSVFVNGHG